MTGADVSSASLAAEIARLRQDFPGYSFWTQPTWNGTGIAATRSDGAEGLHTLVTADPAEIRAELDSSPWLPIVRVPGAGSLPGVRDIAAGETAPNLEDSRPFTMLFSYCTAMEGICRDPRRYMKIAGGIPAITVLCQQYEYCRGTVARGLRILEQEGILCRVRGLGYYVSSESLAPLVIPPRRSAD